MNLPSSLVLLIAKSSLRNYKIVDKNNPKTIREVIPADKAPAVYLVAICATDEFWTAQDC